MTAVVRSKVVSAKHPVILADEDAIAFTRGRLESGAIENVDLAARVAD
jgi:hypothetical protein